MRLLLGALLGAVGAFAISRRPPSDHRPPQPGYAEDQRTGGAASGDDRHNGDQPQRPTPHEGPSERRDTSDERHQRRECWYWAVTGLMSILATGATGFAAWFAWGAYTAALEAVSETRRQADIAQDALVASTRARLKITAIADASASRPAGGEVVWFGFKPTYKNFGQTPAQNISFHPSVFVVGTGDSPRSACDEGRRRFRSYSREIVFPQEEGGKDWIGIQMPLEELEAQAAKVRAIAPDGPIYLGVVGCVTYRSSGSDDVYATGFSGDLHLADEERSGDEEFVPLYDILFEGDGALKVQTKINILSAWAD